MKCIACNCTLTETELMMVKDNGEFEDMCHECRGIAFNPWACDTHEYQFQRLTDFEFIGEIYKDEEMD